MMRWATDRVRVQVEKHKTVPADFQTGKQISSTQVGKSAGLETKVFQSNSNRVLEACSKDHG